MKTKKLKKQLNSMEATLNSLMYYLVETPLEKKIQQEHEQQAQQDRFDAFMNRVLPAYFNKDYTPFTELYKQQKHLEYYSIDMFKYKLKVYCAQNNIDIEFNELKTTNENGSFKILLYFKVVKP